MPAVESVKHLEMLLYAIWSLHVLVISVSLLTAVTSSATDCMDYSEKYQVEGTFLK
jgi:hypothetical protein